MARIQVYFEEPKSKWQLPDFRWFFPAVLAMLAVIMCWTWARAEVINPEIIAEIESGCNPFAKGSGDYGIMQLRYETWTDVQRHYPELRRYCFKDYKFHPQVNYHFGRMYFKVLKKYLTSKQVPVTQQTLIVAYNRGITKAVRWYHNGARIKDLPKVTRRYLKKYRMLAMR